MSSTSVSVLVPLTAPVPDLAATLQSIERYLSTTGFSFEILTLSEPTYGAALRRGATESKGSVVVVVDPQLPYPVTAIGDAVAMVESGATEVVFGSTSTTAEPPALLRWILVPSLTDPTLHLFAFSSTAAKVVIGESKLLGGDCELELAFLANKYGFRVERLVVQSTQQAWRSYGGVAAVAAAVRIRLINRHNGYRAARRCPVCFSSEVWSCAQVPGNIVRACKRCKCRYLNQFGDDEEGHPVRRVMRVAAPVEEPPDEEKRSRTAREKTSLRRLGIVRKQLTSRARLLEIGVRDASFAAAAAREYEYVGIDRSAAVARAAQARSLEVYCATLANFVNTGPAFDAIALFHVFESMADPHDALGRVKELLKPGGVLFLTTFDTEGVLYLLNERKRMTQNFRTRLILYSQSALIELLEHSGFEIASVAPDFEYHDRKFLRHTIHQRWPALAPLARALLQVLPDPLLVSAGSIRIIARRRAGPPINVRAIRSVEPTHAR